MIVVVLVFVILDCDGDDSGGDNGGRGDYDTNSWCYQLQIQVREVHCLHSPTPFDELLQCMFARPGTSLRAGSDAADLESE